MSKQPDGRRPSKQTVKAKRKASTTSLEDTKAGDSPDNTSDEGSELHDADLYSSTNKQNEVSARGSSSRARNLTVPPAFSIIKLRTVKVSNLDTHITATANLVIRNVKKESPLFTRLVVGDQILEVNDQVVLFYEDLKEALEKQEVMLSVLRQSNILAPTYPKDSKIIIRTDRNYYFRGTVNYLNSSNLDVKYNRITKKLMVRRVSEFTPISFIVMKHDKILEYDGNPISQLQNPRNLPKILAETLDKRFKSNSAIKPCTLLIERPITLRTTPNQILFNANKDCPKAEKIGTDACEIGLRESAKHMIIKGRYTPHSIYVTPVPQRIQSSELMDADLVTAEEADEPPVVTPTSPKSKVKRRTKPKKAASREEFQSPTNTASNTQVTQDEGEANPNKFLPQVFKPKKTDRKRSTILKHKGCNTESEVMSDANASDLQKVTSKSGIASFVLSKFGF